MRRLSRSALTAVFAAGAVVVIAACGSSSSSSSSAGNSGTASKGGTITLVMGTAPDSLDPGFGYTTQAAEPDWLPYTRLTTYAPASGTPRGQLTPGLCTALPTISSGGKTYNCTRPNRLPCSHAKAPQTSY